MLHLYTIATDLVPSISDLCTVIINSIIKIHYK